MMTCGMTTRHIEKAQEIIGRCRALAELSEEPGRTTRTFLSPPMKQVHDLAGKWMAEAGMQVRVDAAGNLRGVYAGLKPGARRLLIGSHLDTVPDAGAFDGILGVMLGIAFIEELARERRNFAIEVIGFSEEEGVRFGVPFIGSRAVVGTAGELLSAQPGIAEAIRAFGLDAAGLAEAELTEDTAGYLEMHIEQGPVLDSLRLPLAVVDAIAGQSRLDLSFRGHANHAGTTPMRLRRDALAGAAEWISSVECEGRSVEGLVATVGRLNVAPGAGNVVPGSVRMSLDVRHAADAVRKDAVQRTLTRAGVIASDRGLTIEWKILLDQPSTPMSKPLMEALERAVLESGYPVHQMSSGAGHDAMILAGRIPAAMLFVRSPGGISHHPDEAVLTEDVAAALVVGMRFLDEFESLPCRN